MIVELFGSGDARLMEAMKVRFGVFVDEQHVPPEIEIDEHDDPSDTRTVHALVRGGDAPLAAGRFYERDATTAQIGRMAVVIGARGTGVGRRMLDALVEEARRRGYTRAQLSSQTHAIAFYEKAGFTAFGDAYDDAEIPHRDMEREL